MFVKSEEEARKEWLSLLTDDETVPIDVAYRATYEIRKEYYPYAVYSISCSGEWSAKSIWEHKEEYQVAREETVFYDYQGNECKTGGRDTEYRNGRSIYHERRPVSRTVYDTKTKTVIDNVQATYGDIGPLSLTEYVATSNIPSLSWAQQVSNDQLVTVNDDYFEDFILEATTVSEEAATKEARSDARSELADYARGDVPGDRFENFSLDSFSVQKSTRTDCYLPVYHIVYQYEDESYECYLNGGAVGSGALFGEKPVDNDIQKQAELLDTHKSKTGFFSRKSLFLIGAILLIPMGLSSLFAGCEINSYLGLLGSIMNIVSLLMLIAGLYLAGRFVIMHKANRAIAEEHKRFHGDNEFLRKQILELALSDEIPEEGRQAAVEEWLISHSGGMASGQEHIQHIIEEQTKTTKLLNKATIIVAAILVVVNLIGGILSPGYGDIESTQDQSQYSFGYVDTDEDLY